MFSELYTFLDLVKSSGGDDKSHLTIASCSKSWGSTAEVALIGRAPDL